MARPNLSTNSSESISLTAFGMTIAKERATEKMSGHPQERLPFRPPFFHLRLVQRSVGQCPELVGNDFVAGIIRMEPVGCDQA